MANNLPDLNTFEVDKIIESFKHTYQAETKLISAKVYKVPNQPNNMIVSEWSQRCLERGKNVKMMRYMLSDPNLKACVDIDSVDVSHWILHATSKSGKFRAVIRDARNELSEKENKYLEIWSKERSIAMIDLTSVDVHGDIYTDYYFGSISWSDQEDRVIYIAEQKKPKTSPFYKQMPADKSSDDSMNIGRGNQFLYEENWGENVSPKTQPVIVSCKVAEKSISILQGVPKGISPSQIICDPKGDGVVGVGFVNAPRKLGLFACTNKKNHIFFLSYDGKYTILSDEHASVYFPNFSPDGKYLVWFQRPQSGPHHCAHSIMRCNWDTKVIIPIIDVIQESILTENGLPFFGMYGSGLPGEQYMLRCWTSDSKHFLFSTNQKYCIRTFAVDMENGRIWDIGCGNEDASIFLLDVSEDDYALLNITSFKHSSVMASLHIPSLLRNYSNENILVYLTTPTIHTEENVISNFTVSSTDKINGDCFATYYGSEKNHPDKSTPLIMYLHGGPHYRVANVFTPEFNLFIESGFGVLIPHFHGSTGMGQKYVESLIGKMGTLDVDDCYHSLRTALDKFPWLDPNQVLLLGGSSGGFLIAHLSSQYPNDIRGAVMRNPVTDVYLRCFLTDIPDWTTVHLGYPYNGLADIISNPELYTKMIDISPTKYIQNVKTPTLLLLGKNDLRVPSPIGLTYYHILKEKNVPTKVLFYDDQHNFRKVLTEMDSVINSTVWFKRCLSWKQRE